MIQDTGADKQAQIPPPSLSREYRLPVQHLHPEDFEQACRDLAGVAFPNHRAELKRTRGAAQFEVDVECFDGDQEPEIVIQSKRYKDIKPTQITGWVSDFINELSGHWKDRKVKRYILAITVEGNNDEFNAAFRDAAKRLKRHNILFEPWMLAKLTDLFREDASLVHRYFNQYHVDAISPKSLLASASANTVSANAEVTASGGSASLSAITQLSGMVTDAVETNLDLLEDQAKSGRSAALREFLKQQYEVQSNWDSLVPPTKARILRRMMLIALKDDDLEAATLYFGEASQYSAPKDRSGEAYLIQERDGLEAAVEFLQGTSVAAEQEVLVGFLIALGEGGKASKLVKHLPDSPERYRLSALIAILQNRRADAVEHAKRATALRDSSYGTHLALLLAHVNAALIEGANVEIALAPNPFNPSSARADLEARSHLDAALISADRIIGMAEPEIANEVKVWRFVALACHPEKALEARAYAQEVLSSGEASPLFIAWTLSLGIEIRHSKLRKYLEDRVRKGVGNPTDVVVAALVVHDKEPNSGRAGKLIEKHLPRFPEAKEFLEDWKVRVSEKPRELIVLVTQGASGDFEGLVKEALAAPIDPGFVISAAEILRNRKAFRELNLLKAELLQIGNARSIELVATGLLECGDPEGAIQVIDENLKAFGGLSLPTNILRLRTVAADRTGFQGMTLNALEQLNEKVPSLDNQVQIIRRAYALNDTDRLLRYSRQLRDEKGNAGNSRLLAAEAVSALDPQLARELLTKFVESDLDNPDYVPKLMELSTRLGANSVLQAQRFTAFQQAFFADESKVLRLDSVEDALKMISERGEELRKLRLQWLEGRMASQVAFATEASTFAKLFLMPTEYVISETGDHYPPLTCAAGLLRELPKKSSNHQKRTLIVDLSALLISARYEIIDALDQTYDVLVSPAVPFALRDIIEKMPHSSGPGIEREALGLFEDIRRELEEKVECIRNDQQSDDHVVHRRLPNEEPDPALVNLVSYLSEHEFIEQPGLLRLRQILNIQESAEIAGVQAPGPLLVDGSVLLSLVRAEAAIKIAEIAGLRIYRRDYEQLVDAVRHQKALFKARDLVTDLLDKVQSKLRNDEWRQYAAPQREEYEDSSPQAPHVASLHDCMEAIREDSERLVYIEDRFVARHQFTNVVSFDEIVRRLRVENALSQEELEDIQRKRYASGTGFLPIDLKPIVEALKTAPIENGQMQETALLQRLRRNFATQAKLLRFSDWDEHRLVDGRFIGEPRHILDMMHLIENIFAGIWTVSEHTEDFKQAASNWAWSAFRLEFFHRDKAAEPARERHLSNIALLFIQALSWPFFDKMKDTAKKWDAYEPFIDWFVGAIAYPRFKLEPELRARFVREFVRMYDAQITSEDAALTDLEPELVSQYYVREIRGLLDIFPNWLKDAILSHGDFAKTLGIERDFAMKTSAGEVAAGSVEEALKGRKDISSPYKGEVETTTGNRLAVEYVLPEGQIVPKIKLVDKKSVANLSDETSVVTLPARAEREAAFDALDADIQTAPGVQEQIRRAITEQPTVSARLRALAEARKGDFAFHEAKLAELLSERESLTDSDLALPKPVALANYLRMNLEVEVAPADRLSRGYASLQDEIGVEAAHVRYCACPYEFDRDTPEIGDLLIKGDSMFQFAYVLGDANKVAAADPAQASEAWSRLVEIKSDQLPLFVPLVRAGCIQSLIGSEWANIDPDIKLALIWIWADRLSAAFVARQIDIPPLVEKVVRRTTAFLPAMMEVYDKGHPFGQLGMELTELRVSQILLRQTLDAFRTIGHDDPIRQQVLEWVGITGEKGWMPDPKLLFHNDDNRRGLRAGLSLDDLFSLEVPLSDTIKDALRGDRFWEEMIEEAGREPDPTERLVLATFAEIDELSDEQAQQAWDLLAAYFESSAASFAEKYQKAEFYMLAELAARLGKGSEFFDILDLLSERFERVSSKSAPFVVLSPDSDDRDELFVVLAESVISFYRASSLSIGDKVQGTYAKIAELSKNWPGTEAATLIIISHMHDTMPSEVASATWSYFEDVRATL